MRALNLYVLILTCLASFYKVLKLRQLLVLLVVYPLQPQAA